jgi:NTE family protein
VVLSGGGAAGVAHVGVLKALEERHIPIDFVVGTSAGALVASMYACGYSPAEIEAYILSEPFQLMVKGEVEVEKKFFF